MGQVYGLHLLRGGAEVTFFVREKYREELEAGLTLHPLRARPREPEALRPTAVRSDMEAVGEGYDQVWLCVPTTALTSGGLDVPLNALREGDASLVAMMPGMQVRRLLDEVIPRERVVDGLIGMVAYPAPLPGETFDPPGVAYVLPRLSATKFSGADPTRVDAVANALRAGGAPVGVVQDARVSLALSSSVMMPMIVALEGAGWSLRELRRGDGLQLAGAAAREAMGLVAAELEVSPPWYRSLIRRPLLSLITRVAPWLSPFDTEVYLRAHFTKIRAQTQMMIRGYVASGAKLGLQATSIAELGERVFGAEALEAGEVREAAK